MDKDYKRIMRCIEITDHRSKNVDVKNLRVSLYMRKHIKVPKGPALKDLRDRKEYIGRKFVFKVDYSDKKENI